MHYDVLLGRLPSAMITRLVVSFGSDPRQTTQQESQKGPNRTALPDSQMTWSGPTQRAGVTS
jgi:hypothetical protein